MLKFIPRFIARRLFIIYGLLTRAMTLGVRVVVQNESGGVLLVEHTYVSGWHLPGGGVERGETLRQAVTKELREEAFVELSGEPVHFHTYLNTKNSRFDHVALFVAKDWASIEGWEPNSEIAQIGFFDVNDLPDGVTSSTKARLQEVFENAPPSNFW